MLKQFYLQEKKMIFIFCIFSWTTPVQIDSSKIEKNVTNKYFTKLKSVIKKNKYTPHIIYEKVPTRMINLNENSIYY